MLEIEATIRLTDEKTGLRIDRQYLYRDHDSEGSRLRYKAFHMQAMDEMIEELTRARSKKAAEMVKRIKKHMEKRHGGK